MKDDLPATRDWGSTGGGCILLLLRSTVGLRSGELLLGSTVLLLLTILLLRSLLGEGTPGSSPSAEASLVLRSCEFRSETH